MKRNDNKLNNIPKEILDNYNISNFDSIDEAFEFLFDEDYTKEDIIAMLTDEMKEELVLQNENIRKSDNKYYYCSDMDSLEYDIEKLEEKSNTNKTANDKVLFFTKIVRENPKIDNSNHNGEMVEIISFQKGKDVYCDRYTVRFNDGTIAEGIMSCELDFDHYIPGDKIYESEEEQER